jgi:AAA15 family ATPase/GTPase
MINSLEIRNFRNLKNLKINSLGRVNLFTGKNNTGKSTILEALTIYATKGDLNLIYQLLDERGESYRQKDTTQNATEINIKALSSLFIDRQIGYSQKDALSIGEIETTLFGTERSNEKFVSLRFVRYRDDLINNNENDPNQGIRRRTVIDENNENFFIDYNIGLEVRSGNSSYILQLDRTRPYRMILRNAIDIAENYQFIRTRNIDKEINGKLWDNITLSKKETYVIDALKIIEPNAERIAFIDNEDSPRTRTAVIKLNDSNVVVPLRSMGDGINRILTIILALVNSDNGFLLIDEFENGLHYTVQEKLWEIIFNLSETLNVQIFATTHSSDCISGFESVLNYSNNELLGKLIRLDLKSDGIRQVEFDANELKIANKNAIETR